MNDDVFSDLNPVASSSSKPPTEGAAAAAAAAAPPVMAGAPAHVDSP
jgi:hypothetical protein